MKDKKIQVLQLGATNWAESMHPENEFLDWTYLPITSSPEAINDWLKKNKQPSVLLLLAPEKYDRLDDILSNVTPYRIVYDPKTLVGHYELQEKLDRAFAMSMDLSQREVACYQLTKYFYLPQYGDRLMIKDVYIAPGFSNSATYEGSANLAFDANFGHELKSVASWQVNTIAEPRFNHEYWLENTMSRDVHAELTVRLLAADTLTIVDQKTVDLAQQDAPFIVASDFVNEYFLSFSLRVRGNGQLRIGNLHHRRSRGTFGQYILGAKRHVDDDSEELMTYFDPGNLKPPLTVYFSGYRTAEGFEGYPMMKGLKQPFLLIADPRLEGGSFYIGSPELEASVVQTIQNALKQLGFEKNALILSGLSMGTFGALYYASDLEPAAVIVGKPLTNLGNIAANGVLVRPGEFGTATDLLLHETGGTTAADVDTLNQKFWQKFRQSSFDHTLFAIAYMTEDDYDQTAYEDILSELGDGQAVVIGKGISGRHNDNTGAIIDWFYSQYQRIIKINQ